MHRLHIGRRYSVNGGARFARVACMCGWIHDVRVRGRAGLVNNAWGDPAPVEETRAGVIKEMATRLHPEALHA